MHVTYTVDQQRNATQPQQVLYKWRGLLVSSHHPHQHILKSNMSGRGKGGKGLGKGGAKRHRKILRDNIQGVYIFSLTDYRN